jgi:hypothetical protein
MFSILNELKDNSPSSIIGVVGTSIGSAASIYIVVAITGYLTFGNAVVGNIVSMCTFTPRQYLHKLTKADPTGAASTIGKAAIVVLVTFSVPLQVHPCRASLDAVLKWRPNRNSSSNRRTVTPLLPASPAGDHGSTAPMSDLRFAVITTFILTFAYMTALSVTSLDRVLAFVGSTGSTSISFILPGLFYYKISNPDSIHHQRLAKEDDDIDEDTPTSDVEDSAALAQSTTSVRSGVSIASNASTRSSRNSWRWRRKWRWDLEHIEHHHLRRLALALAIYGSVVMTVCLVLNIFFAVTH